MSVAIPAHGEVLKVAADIINISLLLFSGDWWWLSIDWW